MIWFIIVGIVALVLCGYMLYSMWDDCGLGFTILMGPILSGCVLLLAGLAAIGINMGIGWVIDAEGEEYTETQEIVSLSDSTGVATGGFLYITSEDQYSYYIENQDGSFELKSIDAEDVKIHEISEGQPRVEHTESYEEIKFWYGETPTDESYDIFVPDDSVVREFELDAQ